MSESGVKLVFTGVGWIYSKRISKIQGKIIGEMGQFAEMDM